MKDGATFRDMIIKHEQQILNFSQVMLRFSESIEKIDMRSDERMTKMGDGIGELNNTMSKVLAVLRSEGGYDGTQGTVGRTIAAIDLKVTELTKDVNKREKAKRQKRMRSAVASLTQYMATYDKQPLYESYQDHTFIEDVLYGLGVALEPVKYKWGDGFDKFKVVLREHLQPRKGPSR